MFCHNCGTKLPDRGSVNFCPECGKKVMSKVVNRLIERDTGLQYEPSQDQPFNGKFISRYGNGQVEKEIHYKDGLADGLFTAWHSNVRKESEGMYKEGKQEGLWTWWNDHGQQIVEKYYKNGVKHGLWVDWHENGTEESRG